MAEFGTNSNPFGDDQNPFGDDQNPFGDDPVADVGSQPALIDATPVQPASAVEAKPAAPSNPTDLSFQDFSSTAPPPAYPSLTDPISETPAGRQSVDDNEEHGLLGNTGGSRTTVVTDQKGAAVSEGNFWNLSYYRPWFDVDEKEVARRLFRGVLPINPLLADPEGGPSFKADMYGPFWICTTLIFLITVTTNMVHYLSFEVTPDQKEWHNDFNKLLLASTIIYCYASLIPLVLFFAFKYTAVDAKFIDLVCTYGYALTIFIPVSVLSVIPISGVRWVLALVAFIVSLMTIVQNVKQYYHSSEGLTKGAGAVILGAGILHAGFALALKLLFFHV